MKHFFLFLMTLLVSNNLTGQNFIYENCYKSQITPILSVNPDNVDFSDLEFFKEILKDKQIVILGESSHGDGTTFEAKTRLIKYLIEEMDFNTLAFEGGGFWEMYYASQNITNGGDTKTELGNSWLNLWSSSQQTQALLDYIEINKEKIKLLGIENQLGNIYSIKLAPILDSLIGQEAFAQVDYKLFNKNTLNYYYSLFVDNTYKDRVDMIVLKKDFLTIKENLLISKNQHANAMIQGIKNYEGFISQMVLNNGSYSDQNKSINLRDSLMAENVFWELDQHPKNKIIIWTANLHASHHLDQAIYKDNDDFYQVFKPLGQRVFEKYGDELFSIAFTSISGECATVYEQSPQTIEIEKNTWDYELAQLINNDYAFVNFENIRINEECSNTIFESTILGYQLHSGSWFNIFDGVFFIKKMQRSRMKK